MVCTVIFMSNPTVVLCCVDVGVLTKSNPLNGTKLFTMMALPSYIEVVLLLKGFFNLYGNRHARRLGHI